MRFTVDRLDHLVLTCTDVEITAAWYERVLGMEPEDVVGHLHSFGIAIEAGPAKKMGALGEMSSVYCRDPDGNLIEISSYLS